MVDRSEVGRETVVAARAAHFRTVVGRAGGPALSDDASAAGLDRLWTWFIKRHRMPARASLPGLQRAGTLPDWCALRQMSASELGAELVLLLDGLAAHVAVVLQRLEPGAIWVREKDPWFPDPISKLELPGRPSLPVDVVVVDLGYTALKGDDIARRPEALRDLVERCLAVGDPRMRLFEWLTRAEAKQLLSEVASGHEQRTDAFRLHVRQARGPTEDLDQSIDSLLPLWRWLAKQPRPKRPAMDREIRARGAPWWYDFWPWFAPTLGPELAILATGAADYMAACIQDAVPGTDWALGTDRLGDFRQPILRLGGRVPFPIHEHVLRLIAAALAGDKQSRQPETLRTLAQRWVVAAAAAPMAEVGTDEPYRIVVIRDEPFDYQVTLSSEVAHDEAMVGSFLAALRHDSRVGRVIHEDREVILVNSRAGEEDFRDASRLAWSTALAEHGTR